MLRFLFAILIAIAIPAHAGEWYIHTISTHVPRGPHRLSEFNYGLAYRWDSDWRVGAYRNSYDHPSAYATRVIDLSRAWHCGIGAVSGYRIGSGWCIREGRRSEVIPIAMIEWTPWPHMGILVAPTVVNLELRY